MVADVVCTSEASISVTVDSRPPANFIKELEKYVRVSVLPEKTIICIVGQGINQKNNILEKIFSAIKEHPIRMISQNSFARNITLVVDKKDSQKIIEIVYRKIFKK